MKKIFTLILMIVSLVVLGSIVSQKGSAASEVNPNEEVADLFAKYYNDGRYTKDTKIFINDESQELKEEIMAYFHAEVTDLERTTYYSKDALWMSRANGKYSYYGTAYEGGNAVGVTNATASAPYEVPADAPVALSGAGKTSMEEYFCTLNDFVLGSHTSAHTEDVAIALNANWSLVDGVYYNTSAGVLNGFRLFTAPLWLNTAESKNYISFSLATVEVVDGDLVMTLWTSAGDVSKLSSDSATKAYNGQTYHAFSKATIQENNIDGEKGTFYDNITPITGRRTGPVVSHESYVYLGEKGVYVYQIIEDGKGIVKDKSHVELFFTIGEDVVVDKSLSVHIYPNSADPLRSYTFSSTTGLSRNDNLAKTYCSYATKVISNNSTLGKYAVELFLDYSYFGLTEAPESIKMQFGAVSGEGNPLANNVSGGVDYKTISKYYTVKNPEFIVDAKKDAKYDLAYQYNGKRDVISYESSIYLGEKGIYVYQYVEDGKGIVSGTSHVEWYFTLGEEAVADNSLSVHLYPKNTDAIRSYRYSSTTNVVRDNTISKNYCDYEIKVISDSSSLGKYVVELFVDYSYFGLTEAPKSINVQIRAIAGGNNPLTNNTTGGLDYKVIANHFTVKNPEIVVDGNKDAKYDQFTPLTGSRSEASHEVYVYFGEDGFYIYQLVKDKTVVDGDNRVQLYLTTGTDALTQDNAFGIYYYQNNGVNFRPYYFDVAQNKYIRKDELSSYCQYTKKIVGTSNGYTLYAYEVFVSYEYFGLTEAPETVNFFAVARINTGGAVAFDKSTNGTDNNIATYVTINKNGKVQ